MTMTTLIEDVSNKGQASGRVGMSDVVMNPRKKHWKSGRKMSAVGSKEPQKDTVQRQCVEVCAALTNWKNEGCDKFDGDLCKQPCHGSENPAQSGKEH